MGISTVLVLVCSTLIPHEKCNEATAIDMMAVHPTAEAYGKVEDSTKNIENKSQNNTNVITMNIATACLTAGQQTLGESIIGRNLDPTKEYVKFICRMGDKN